jgi:hypothetical protein
MGLKFYFQGSHLTIYIERKIKISNDAFRKASPIQMLGEIYLQGSHLIICIEKMRKIFKVVFCKTSRI